MTDNIKSLEPVAWECSSPEGEKPALAFLTSKKPTVEHCENQGWRVPPLYAAPVDDNLMNVGLSTETVDNPVHSGAGSAMVNDAERYRWLRADGFSFAELATRSDTYNGNYGGELDDVIDAAIAASAEEGDKA